MRLRDPDGWAEAVDANPTPSGCDPEPESWPPHAELTHDQRGDAYGAIVIIAAQRWAEAMEDRLSAGADAPVGHEVSVADVAAGCFASVNRDLGGLGLTGFQYGAAVSILAQVWEYGEELRRWHNLATQLGDECERANESGGTLNPALLNLGTVD